MDNLSTIIESFVSLDLNKDAPSVVKTLESLIKRIEDGSKELKDLDFEKSGLSKCLDKLLEGVKSDKTDVSSQSAQAIAEIAKLNEPRKILTNIHVIKPLLSLMSSNRPMEVRLQGIRSVGNIAFDNDEARNVLLSAGAVERVIEIIEYTATAIDTNSENAMRAKLASMATGCLLNIIMGQEQIYRTVYDEALPFLKKLLPVSDTQTKIHIYSLLGILTDVKVERWAGEDKEEDGSMDGEVVDNLGGFRIGIIDSIVAADCVATLTSTDDPDLCLLIVELLHSEADCEDAGMKLAEASLPELLVSLVDQHHALANDEDTRALLNMATDIIILILNHDKSMKVVWDRGSVYEGMLRWLSSSDKDLVLAALLAIANFARSDSHCTYMVGTDLPSKLINLLKVNRSAASSTASTPVKDLEPKIQHAVLSALRNLAIPRANKKRLISLGIIDVVCPLLLVADQQHNVLYKALASLRIVTDGEKEAALDVLSRRPVIEKAAFWARESDHAGVQAEASRLIAWLLRTASCWNEACGNTSAVGDSGSSDSHNPLANGVVPKVPPKVPVGSLQPDLPSIIVPALAAMMSVRHPIMQVEALNALYILAVSVSPASILLSEIQCGKDKHQAMTPSVDLAIIDILSRDPLPTAMVFNNLVVLLNIASSVIKEKCQKERCKAIAAAIRKAISASHLASFSKQVNELLKVFDSVPSL